MRRLRWIVIALVAFVGAGCSVPVATPATTPALTPPAVTATPAATPTPAPTDAPYLDDRSSAETVIRSYYDAINRREYARAYAYWDTPAGAPDGPPPFAEFVAGYADTVAVDVTLGAVGGDAGAGQLYYAVPVALAAQTTGGAVQHYAGCYVLHLAQPAAQGVPPFRPLAIRSVRVEQAADATDAAAQRASACADYPAAPMPPAPTPDPLDISPARYLDDRSTGTSVILSYFNAVNRREYVRAYSYWETTDSLPPFAEFAEGYAETEAVQVTTGEVRIGAAAGNRYEQVPVTLVARTTGGATQTFVGCYTLHLADPALQAEPPFRPLAIQSAEVEQVANDADTAALLAQACPQP